MLTKLRDMLTKLSDMLTKLRDMLTKSRDMLTKLRDMLTKMLTKKSWLSLCEKVIQYVLYKLYKFKFE